MFFTHMHGKGFDAAEKIRVSFRLIPRNNEKDFTEQLTLEEFKTMKYAVWVRRHFMGIDDAEYFISDFSDNNFQPVFIQKIKSFVKHLCHEMSLQDNGWTFNLSPFEYESSDCRFRMMINPVEPLYKVRNGERNIVDECVVKIWSDSWKDDRKKERCIRSFKFTVSNMELRSALYSFIKENEYEIDPYTFRTELEYCFSDSLRCYKQSRKHKEKPVLLVDVRSLFFDEGKGFCFDYCLRNFDEKFSRYFEPVYIWTGEKITDFQRKEFFQYVNGKLFYHAGDYFNPGFVQCFYISKTLEPKFNKAFRQFYAVTFLLYTGNMESILEIARDMYKTLIAKEKCIFKGNYISAFNYSENIFEVNGKALSKLHVMDMRYLLENDYCEVMDNFVYDNEAPEDCYFSFYRRNDEVIMAGVFPDDCHLYQKWSRVANIFYDYTGRIPTEITASPDIWNEDDIEEIITDRILNEADELTVIDGDECYAFLDFLDRRKFKQKKFYYGRQIIGEDADSVGPKNRAWFFPQLYDEKFNFGKTEVDVVLDEHFPENCYVIYSEKGEED
ncbi:hypothetical protein [Treponema sp.]|uniref:hypothetical protein n=1 Tax=Treponema sp. TaxID=166 RepID=UPI00298D9BA6|nr:hypothetical protein [Treponema sp.]MCQ2241942.1 hypothetical protein [Treponema sp.]